MTAMNTGMNSAALDRLMVFTGNANPRLAQEVAKHLNLSLGRVIAGKFSDGEVMVELLENVRGKDVFILQSTCAPTNDTLMELLIMSDALRRSSAARITAAMPYFGYARQDRRPRSARVAISAKVVANTLVSAGVNRRASTRAVSPERQKPSRRRLAKQPQVQAPEQSYPHHDAQ